MISPMKTPAVEPTFRYLGGNLGLCDDDLVVQVLYMGIPLDVSFSGAMFNFEKFDAYSQSRLLGGMAGQFGVPMTRDEVPANQTEGGAP